MRLKIIIALILISLNVMGQSGYVTKDTTFDGWNARITYISGFADSNNIFIWINGVSEVGSDTTKQSTYGYHYWNQHGWDGNITFGTSVHYPVYVTLQPSATFPTPSTLKPKFDAIIDRFKVKYGGVAVAGLSMGGWAWLNWLYYEPSAGDYSYPGRVRVVMSLAGMKADDNYGADPYSWPNYFGHAAKNSTEFHVLAFEQVNDGRGQDAEIKSMIDSLSGDSTRFKFFWTNFGSSGHSNFNDMCDPSQQNWTETNADVQHSNGGAINTIQMETGYNIWQWAWLQFADTSQPTEGNVKPDITANPDTTITIPIDTISIRSSASDADGTITSHFWRNVSGSCTITSPTSYNTTITGIAYGTYVLKFVAYDDFGDSSYSNITINNGIPCGSSTPVTYTISTTSPNEIYITDASSRGWKGGDTLLIPAGTYTTIEIDSFGGDPCRDIYIRNVGGQVIVTGPIRFKKDVHYVKIVGKDSAGITYGFKCTTWGSDRVSHFTMRRIEIGPNPAGVGIFLKQDPVDTTRFCDQYPNYVNRKVTIDSIYIHNVEGEGMYIGHTGPDGNSETYYRLPQRGDSITISNCIVDSTGWDGIQLSNSRNGCLIYGNTVTNFGLIDNDQQRAGIISGGNLNSKVYNNYVANGTGNGIEVFGYGTCEVYNNTISNVGNTGTNANGEESFYARAYVNAIETNPKQKLYIYNNQINYPKNLGAIRVNDQDSNSDSAILNGNKFCFSSPPASDWKDDYIIMPQGYYDTSNILYCVISGRIRIKLRIRNN